jgi:hypothetical protein
MICRNISVSLFLSLWILCTSGRTTERRYRENAYRIACLNRVNSTRWDLPSWSRYTHIYILSQIVSPSIDTCNCEVVTLFEDIFLCYDLFEIQGLFLYLYFTPQSSRELLSQLFKNIDPIELLFSLDSNLVTNLFIFIPSFFCLFMFCYFWLVMCL